MDNAGKHFNQMKTQSYTSTLFESSLIEQGSPVRLHFIVHKPSRPGPYPVLIFNHGSSGLGLNPDEFKQHTPYQSIANLFTERGWMVIIPHRRGRGDSDGEYKEGLGENGYSGDVEIALQGVERALTDLDAALDIIQKRSDVDKNNMVIGGHSRGGLLSIALAGKYPGHFKGVLNFVGGWLSESFTTGFQVNSEIANRGAKAGGNSLWLYSGRDCFYSLAHTQSIFKSFTDHGGKGSFILFDQADHDLIWSKFNWQKAVSGYMHSNGYQEFVI